MSLLTKICIAARKYIEAKQKAELEAAAKEIKKILENKKDKDELAKELHEKLKAALKKETLDQSEKQESYLYFQAYMEIVSDKLIEKMKTTPLAKKIITEKIIPIFRLLIPLILSGAVGG